MGVANGRDMKKEVVEEGIALRRDQLALDIMLSFHNMLSIIILGVELYIIYR